MANLLSWLGGAAKQIAKATPFSPLLNIPQQINQVANQRPPAQMKLYTQADQIPQGRASFNPNLSTVGQRIAQAPAYKSLQSFSQNVAHPFNAALYNTAKGATVNLPMTIGQGANQVINSGQQQKDFNSAFNAANAQEDMARQAFKAGKITSQRASALINDAYKQRNQANISFQNKIASAPSAGDVAMSLGTLGVGAAGPALAATTKVGGVIGIGAKTLETGIGAGFAGNTLAQLPAEIKNINSLKGAAKTQAILETIPNVGLGVLGAAAAAHGGVGLLKDVNAHLNEVPISKLTSYEGAPDRAAVNAAKKDILSGKGVPPLKIAPDSLGNLGVVDGQHRLQAYKELGYKNVPIENPLTSQRGAVALPGNPEQLASQKALEFAKDPNNFTPKGDFKPAIQKQLTDLLAGNTSKPAEATVKNYRPRIPQTGQKVNPAVATLASKTTVLDKIGTPSSQLAAEKIRSIDNMTQDLRAGYRNSTRTALSLSKGEFNNLGDVIEHGAKPINAKVAQAASEAGSTLPKVLQDYTATGAKTGNIKNYFPRDYSGLKKGSATYNQAIQSLLDKGQAKSTAEAVGILDRLKSGSTSTKPGFFGSFDVSRYDVPGYSYSKNAYEKYLNGAAQRTSQATHFGPKGEVANQLVGRIAREGGDAELANKAITNYLHSAGAGKSDFLAPVRGIFGAARLGKAPVSHLGQFTNIPLVTRLQDLPTGAAKLLTKEGRDFITESDVNNPANIHGLTTQETSVKGALSKVTAAGLSPVMKNNRGLAALAGRDYAQYLAKTGNVIKLRDLGVTGDIGKALTHEQELQAARGVANKTMFSPTRAATPISAETPLGKTIGQYRTAYSYKQTGLIWNNVIKAAGRGDIKPLTKFLALSVPVGAGTVALKSAISGTNTWQKEGIGGKALDVLGAVGGIPGELAVQGARYAGGNILKTLAGAVAPLAGEAVDIGQRTQEAIQGKPQQLERYGLGLVPVVGSKLAASLVPTQTAQIDKAKKSTADVTQLNSGKFYAKSLDKQYGSQEAANKAVFLDKFKKGSQKIQPYGNEVYIKSNKNQQGYITKSKVDYAFQKTDAQTSLTMERAKANNDPQSWLNAAQQKYDALETKKKTYDPSTDQSTIDSITLKQENLLNEAKKYQSYGGFTKPKAAKKLSSSSFKITTSKAPKIPGIKVKVASAKFKAPKTRKLSVSKIPSNYVNRKLA